MNRRAVRNHYVPCPCIQQNMFRMYNTQKKWASLPGLRRKHQTDLPPNAASVVRGESDILFYSTGLLIRYFSLTFLSPLPPPSTSPRGLSLAIRFTQVSRTESWQHSFCFYFAPLKSTANRRDSIVLRPQPQIQRKFNFKNGIATLRPKGIRCKLLGQLLIRSERINSTGYQILRCSLSMALKITFSNGFKRNLRCKIISRCERLNRIVP